MSQNTLTMEEIWRRNGELADELHIHYGEDIDYQDVNQDVQDIQPSPQISHQPTGTTIQVRDSDCDNSENITLSKTPKDTSPPLQIYPSDIHFTLVDKTTKFIKTRKNVARKSLARKTKEPRHTLAPQWKIIEDGTITGYSPHTITIDTPIAKNTVIRKNELAIVTEK